MDGQTRLSRYGSCADPLRGLSVTGVVLLGAERATPSLRPGSRTIRPMGVRNARISSYRH